MGERGLPVGGDRGDVILAGFAQPAREQTAHRGRVVGDHDAVISPATHSAAMVRAAPLGSLILLPGVGHMPHHAAADIITRAIRTLDAGQ